MIYLYSGTPGSGKSLHTAQVLYFHLFRCFPAICNFDFAYDKIRRKKLGAFRYVPNDKLTPKLLLDYSQEYFSDHPFHEGRILLVIDECQLMFNAREWDAKGRKDWLSFFTQHRKYGYDIILIAQFDRMIDRQIRSLIEYEQVHRKVSNFGIWGKLFSMAAGGKLFVSVKVWYPMKERVGSEFFKASKKYYSLYDTYKHFETQAPSPSPAGAPAAAGDAAEMVSPAEEQKPKTQRRCHADLGLLKEKMFSQQRRRKTNLQQLFPATVMFGSWTLYSGSGKHLQQFPEGRSEMGWK